MESVSLKYHSIHSYYLVSDVWFMRWILFIRLLVGGVPEHHRPVSSLGQSRACSSSGVWPVWLAPDPLLTVDEREFAVDLPQFACACFYLWND